MNRKEKLADEYLVTWRISGESQSASKDAFMAGYEEAYRHLMDILINERKRHIQDAYPTAVKVMGEIIRKCSTGDEDA